MKKEDYLVKPKDNEEVYIHKAKLSPEQQEWINRCERMMAQIVEKGMHAEPFKKGKSRVKIPKVVDFKIEDYSDDGDKDDKR